MPKIIKISGPPGTGKTTYLLRQIENACTKYDPERIGAVSFSKAAVMEMRDRVTNVLGLRGKSTSNIKTIHAHCYKLLGVEKASVFEDKGALVKEWNEQFPQYSLPTRREEDDLEDLPSLPMDDSYYRNNIDRFRRMQILRNRMIPLDLWGDDEARMLWSSWSKWLADNDYFDFTLMLEKVLEQRLCPNISVLFVDEAQDLSSLQIAVTRMWAEQCDTAIWIGDQDQSIFKFSGAVPEDFRDLKHDWSHVLSQSYRVPGAVHSYAMRLISQIGDRREQVDYLPRDEEGVMDDGHYWPDLDLPGTHMILCRCNFQVSRWTKWLIQRGIVWHNPYRNTYAWNPTSTKLWKAAGIYDRITTGMDVTQQDMIDLISMIKVNGNLAEHVKTNRKKIVESAGRPLFNVFTIGSFGWFKPSFLHFDSPLNSIFSLDGQAGMLLDQCGVKAVRSEPRVVVGTIHSVKGGEADHVWVDLGTTATIARAVHNSVHSQDEEIRLAYVAVTRARKTCHLMNGVRMRNNAFMFV